MNIIVVDDGSADLTYAIAMGVYEKNKRVKVYTKQNGGKSSAPNLGIDKSEDHGLLYASSMVFTVFIR